MIELKEEEMPTKSNLFPKTPSKKVDVQKKARSSFLRISNLLETKSSPILQLRVALPIQSTFK
jgi:hypothetical protein